MVVRVFASGQSNAIGRGTGGPDWSTIDSRVRVWDNANPLGANGTAWRTAAVARSTYGTFENTNRNNFGVWFCHRLAQIRDEDVDMTIVARGGTEIEAWQPGGSQPMLQECIDVYAATGQAPAHVFLWHQGESNVLTSPSTYKADFLALVANLTTAGVIDANTIIILGGLSEDTQARIDFNNNVLRELADENAQVFYANSSGLSSYDGTHFTGGGLYALGHDRYFATYQEAMDIMPENLYALVNEGGTPGIEGSGANKILDITGYKDLGISAKDVTLPASFDGILPGNDLLTPLMIAAGAIVEYGAVENHRYWRFESGLQICVGKHSALATANSASGSIFYSETISMVFLREFLARPIVIPIADKSTAGSSLVWATVSASNPTVSGVGIAILGSINTASAIPAYIAIGVWK